MLRWLLAILLLLPWSGAAAETPIVVSKLADDLAVTFYRDGSRSPDEFLTFDADDEDEPLGGFAMIAETRTITLPPGEAIVRFEGVASGIIPQSAIMINGDLKEKNFDSRLLSMRGLVDAFTGQRVTIRRTNDVTGKVTSEAGNIVTRPDGAILLKTARGYETVACQGNLDTILFPGLPKDLTAKPTLSMTTRPDNPGGTMTVTVAYLADNFDWQANYVGTFAPDGQSLKLSGWLTLASKDKTSFANAEVNAVAGHVLRAFLTDEEEDALEDEKENNPYAEDNIDLDYACWPQGRTASGKRYPVLFGPGSLPTKTSPIYVHYSGYGFGGCDDDGVCDDAVIVVTGSRRVTVSDLGDLKLYSLPFKTNVPSKNMKQAQFLRTTELKGETLYRGEFRAGDGSGDDMELVFKFENKKKNGAGKPLPSGHIALFQHTRAGRQLVGETHIADKAVNEEVKIKISDDDIDVDFDVDDTDKEGETKQVNGLDIDWQQKELTIENDFEFPVTVEIEFSDNPGYDYNYKLSRFSRRLKKKDGKRIWRVVVAAESEASSKFRETEFELPEIDN